LLGITNPDRAATVRERLFGLLRSDRRIYGNSGRLLTARLFFFEFVVDGNLFQVFGFKDLVAIHAADIVNPIAAHQEFRARVITDRHTNRISLF